MTTTIERDRESAVRRRNARGQGDRLRADIIDAARDILAETGDVSRLTLRAVARRVGVATTSIYLHFSDGEDMAIAAITQTFAELSACTNTAAEGMTNPADALLARSRAYCHFAMNHSGHYRVMFDIALVPRLAKDPDNTPGRRAFQLLVDAVQRCIDAGYARGCDDSFRLASQVWAAEHGLVSLRLSRPRFRWADLDGLVDDSVSRIMGFVT